MYRPLRWAYSLPCALWCASVSSSHVPLSEIQMLHLVGHTFDQLDIFLIYVDETFVLLRALAESLEDRIQDSKLSASQYEIHCCGPFRLPNLPC